MNNHVIVYSMNLYLKVILTSSRNNPQEIDAIIRKLLFCDRLEQPLTTVLNFY